MADLAQQGLTQLLVLLEVPNAQHRCAAMRVHITILEGPTFCKENSLYFSVMLLKLLFPSCSEQGLPWQVLKQALEPLGPACCCLYPVSRQTLHILLPPADPQEPPEPAARLATGFTWDPTGSGRGEAFPEISIHLRSACFPHWLSLFLHSFLSGSGPPRWIPISGLSSPSTPPLAPRNSTSELSSSCSSEAAPGFQRGKMGSPVPGGAGARGLQTQPWLQSAHSSGFPEIFRSSKGRRVRGWARKCREAREIRGQPQAAQGSLWDSSLPPDGS